jgi:hypothetical protein
LRAIKILTAGTLLACALLGSLIEPSITEKYFSIMPVGMLLEIFSVLLVGLLVWWNLHIYFKIEIEPSYSRTIDEIEPVPGSEAYELQRLAGKVLLNARQARLFTLALLEPAELRQRVTERYSPSYRTLEQEVTIDIQIPRRLLTLREASADAMAMSDEKIPALLPVIVLPKGTFSDNFEVFDSDDRRIPTLSYKEYLQLVAGILRLFLRLAYDLPATSRPPQFPASVTGSADTDVLHLEHRALREIIRRAQANVEAKRVLGISPVSDEAEEVAQCLEKLDVAENRRVFLSVAAALVRKLSLHYSRVASIPFPPSGRMLVRYRRTLIPELELSPHGEDGDVAGLFRAVRRMTAWLRILFSARPVSVTVSLDNAWTCQSYHVWVEAPDALYLAKQRFIATPEYLAAKAKGAPTKVHYRFRRRLGQSYAHFYGRFFPVPIEGSRRPKVQLDFFEVPPGSDFRAAIASAACSGLVWLVGYVLSRTHNLESDAPAFLLVFPGIAASWLGFDAPTHRLFEGTLAARLSLILTTVTSIAASGLFIAYRSNLPPFLHSLPFGISLVGVNQLWWAVLVAVSCLNSLYMACRWLRHSWRFKHLAERPDPDRL